MTGIRLKVHVKYKKILRYSWLRWIRNLQHRRGNVTWREWRESRRVTSRCRASKHTPRNPSQRLVLD